MQENNFETNLIRLVAAQLHLLATMNAAREIYNESYFALKLKEKASVEQSVQATVGQFYHSFDPQSVIFDQEQLAEQLEKTAFAILKADYQESEDYKLPFSGPKIPEAPRPLAEEDKISEAPLPLTEKEGRFRNIIPEIAAKQIIAEAGDWLALDTVIKRMVEGGILYTVDVLEERLAISLTRNERLSRHPARHATFGLVEWIERDGLSKTGK